MKESGKTRSLCKDICKLLVEGDKLNNKIFAENMLPNKMVVNLNVFFPGLKKLGLKQGDSTAIVTIKSWKGVEGNAKIM